LIFIPLIVFLVSLHLAVALPLYWLVSSTIAYFQQARVLEGDVTEAEVIASAPSGTNKKTADEVKVTRSTINEPSKTKKSSKASSKKRRKR
jgi:membrane protein insertase Oxa1/YidC/SpoIIIJ